VHNAGHYKHSGIVRIFKCMRHYFDRKYILFYFILAVLFRYIFMLIPPLFITNLSEAPFVIDVAVMETRQLFKTGYILHAEPYYDHNAYWEVYFPLDTVFPVVYSLFFISVADLVRRKRTLYKWLCALILAGAIFDWAENLFVGLYVSSSSNGLAPVVSFCMSIKSILFGLNLIATILVLAVCGIRRVFFRDLASAQNKKSKPFI
jgi:hypothetical protein